MKILENDIPKNGQIIFNYSGVTKKHLCRIEWEDEGYSFSVCASGNSQQDALTNAIEKKFRMS